MNKLHCYEYNNVIQKSQQRRQQYSSVNNIWNITEGMECYKWITDPIQCAKEEKELSDCRVSCDSRQTTTQTSRQTVITPVNFPFSIPQNIQSSPYLSDDDNNNIINYIQYTDYWNTYNNAINEYSTNISQAYKDIYNSYGQMTTLQNTDAPTYTAPTYYSW